MGQKVKDVLKCLAPRGVQKVYRYLKNELLDGYATKSYAQEGEDMILRRIFERQLKGFYVDVGAHHPKRFSNTYYFYKLGWRGINIDPNPEIFRSFKKFRPRDINIQLGVSDKAGDLTYYMFEESALNTFDEKLLQAQENSSRHQAIQIIKVEVTSLASILETHLPSETVIDFLSIDVEGYDFNVLKSNDWERYRPKYLLVEVLNLSNLRDLQASTYVDTFLKEREFDPIAKTLNTLFYRNTRTTIR